MSYMTEAESFERFSEGIKKAASRAREMGVAQRNVGWEKVASMLELLLRNGSKIHIARSITRAEALRMLDERQAKDAKVH